MGRCNSSRGTCLPFIERLKQEGSKPTIRGVLYYLESIRVVPKNDHTYDRIKRVLGEARRGYRKRDGTRGEPTISMGILRLQIIPAI